MYPKYAVHPVVDETNFEQTGWTLYFNEGSDELPNYQPCEDSPEFKTEAEAREEACRRNANQVPLP